MRKQFVLAILLLIGILAFVKLGVWFTAKERARETRERVRREWAEAQFSQEIVCDACGARTTGLVLNRAQVGAFQECPQCHERAGRPVVYYLCQNPDCNRQLIKVLVTVWTADGPSPGTTAVCPKCGQGRDLTPTFLTLKSAQQVADETNQSFP